MAKEFTPKQLEILRTNIDAEMHRRAWSIKTLAKRSGTGVGTLYNFSSGADIGVSTIFKVAKTFGATMEELQREGWRGSDEEQSAQQQGTPKIGDEEITILRDLARLSPTNRRRAARILRSIVDELEETERAASEGPASSATDNKPRAARAK